MKTKKLFKSATFFIISVASLVSSCNDEEKRLTQQDTQDITEEALTDAYFQDMDDMGGMVLQSPGDQEFNAGRMASTFTFKVRDNRFVCDGDSLVATFERDPNSTEEVPKGKITIDFGSGCADARDNVRAGKLIFTFSGRRFMPGSTVITSGENYAINGVKLEGTRTLTNISSSTADAPEFYVTLVGGKATFEDSTIATRESTIIYKWVRVLSPVGDKLIIDQGSTASGKTRAGRNYEVSLLEPLAFIRFCGFAVSGIKKYVIDEEKEIIIDYGDGGCDKSITVTVNGITRNISVN